MELGDGDAMIDVDDLLRPWLADLAARVGGLELYDAHTHIGLHDPDGFKQHPDELVVALESAGARGVADDPRHAAISDIAWLWRVLPQHRNLYVDTSWWNPTDVCALFALAPPGQILWASDSPYGRPLPSALQVLRCALQMGLDPEQVRAVMGGQLARVLDGAHPADLDPAPGPPPGGLHPLLERVVVHLAAAVSRAFVHADHTEPLGLARLACAVGEQGPHADICAAVLELLNLYERDPGAPSEARPVSPSLRRLVLALYVARTPNVPVGPLPASPPPTRTEAEQSSTS